VAGRRLGLHPREFALLWRLAECPGEDVSCAALVSDVWRLAARPETNSLAVHVSRLRAKLRVAGLDGMLASTAEGYRLDLTGYANWGLDLAPPIVEEPAVANKDSQACATN
jgi:DNA-binding response OmpR family regulator